MRVLDIEDNIERLRYDKVILATDADVDGLHIRNLMITYFFRFFDQVVQDQHLYVLETPLFRVRNSRRRFTATAKPSATPRRRSSAANRRSRASKAWAKFPRRSSSNSSAKVLPHGQQVEYASRFGGMNSQQILTFYMGKNTPERKDYIMENLVVPVEE